MKRVIKLNQYEWLHEHINQYKMLYRNNCFELKQRNCRLKIKDRTKIDDYKEFCENFNIDGVRGSLDCFKFYIKSYDELSSALDFFEEERDYTITTDLIENHYSVIAKYFNKNIYLTMAGLIENLGICENIDTMFIELKDTSLPIGYFNETRGVEAAYMIEDKIQKDSDEGKIEQQIIDLHQVNNKCFISMRNILQHKGVLKKDYIDTSNGYAEEYIQIKGLSMFVGTLRMLLGLFTAVYFTFYLYSTPKSFIKEDLLYIFVFAAEAYYIYSGVKMFFYGRFQYSTKKKLKRGLKFFDMYMRKYIDYEELIESVKGIIRDNKNTLIEQTRKGIVPEITVDRIFLKFYKVELYKNTLCKWMNSLNKTNTKLLEKSGKSAIRKLVYLLILILVAIPFAPLAQMGKQAAREDERVKSFLYTYYNNFSVTNNSIYFPVDTNLYKKRDLDSEVIQTIPANTLVTLVENDEKNSEIWRRVRYYDNGILCRGWVYGGWKYDSNDLYYYHNLPADSSYYKHLPVESVSTESFYNEFNEEKFNPSNIIDSSINTCWRTALYDNGVGEKMTFGFETPQEVSAIKIFPGASDALGKGAFNSYNRLADVEVKLKGNINKKFKYTFADRGSFQVIWFDKSINIKDVEIDIKSVYYGNTYNELVVSEVIFYGRK